MKIQWRIKYKDKLSRDKRTTERLIKYIKDNDKEKLIELLKLVLIQVSR